MLEALRFIQGAVSKKNFVPEMKHVVIEDRFVRAYNGSLALGSPIDFHIDCKPKAEPLVRAIAQCHDTIALSMTPTGRLSIKSGNFRALIDCLDEATPHVQPEGEDVELNGELVLEGMKTIEPFIGNDASRPWSNGVLIRGPSLFATNNVTLVEYWMGSPFPFQVNVPRAAAKEMIRINKPPTHAQVSTNAITFHYEDGRWITTQLISLDWPDLYKVLEVESNPVPIDLSLFEAVDAVRGFVDKMGRLFIADGVVRTHEADEEGAMFELDDNDIKGIYQVDMLNLLRHVAHSADFTLYPAPCMFFGKNLRGAIIGMRA